MANTGNIPVLQSGGAAPSPAIHPFGSRFPFPPEINARIFDHYSFDSNANNIEDLWDFVEQVVTQPNRGLELRQLTFTTVNLYKKFEPQDVRHVLLTTFRHGDRYLRQPKGAAQAHNQPSLVDNDNTIFAISQWYHRALYIRSKPWLLQAFRDIGFDQGATAGQSDLLTQASKVLQAGKPLDGYHLPLIALALAYCPNLARLTLHIWPEATDPWLRRIFHYAVGRQGFVNFNTLGTPPFRRLRTVNTAPKLDRRGTTGLPVANEHEPVSITNVELPFHRLPALQEAVLYHVKTDATFRALLNIPENHTRIEKLLIIGPIYGQLALGGWVVFSTRLRQLSIRVPGNEWPFHAPGGHLVDDADPLEYTGPHIWPGLWYMLFRVRSQLEYLDLYQDLVSDIEYAHWSNSNQLLQPFCFSFAQFPVLRHLTISPLIMGGINCRHIQPNRLRAHIPPNVETLGLYGANIHYLHGYPVDPRAIQAEIQGITADAHELRCLILESRLRGHLPPGAFRSRYRHAHADAALKGIQLRHDGENTMFYGGKGTWIGRSIMEDAESWTRRLFDMESRHSEVIPQGLVVHGIEGKLQDTRIAPGPAAQAAARDDDNDDDAMDVD
ncbi:hypothetical protein BJX62DRAFT_231833 [Aspergillus germanicus]